jgi:uncharacterized DUF497 family protein
MNVDISKDTKRIICKVDGKIFKDLDNRSGVLSVYLKKLNIQTDNVLDYYEIVDYIEEKQERWKCKYCDWSTKDIKNVSGWITTHLKSKHDVTPTQHITQYPEDKVLWISTNVVTNKEVREFEFDNNNQSYIICLECGDRMKRITKTHLSLHNMNMDDYRKKYNLENEPLCSSEFSNKMKDNYYDHFSSINSIKKISTQEKEICEFLEEHSIKYEQSNRKIIYPLEVDIYIPSKKVAIEINGLYWHSEKSGNKLKDYHLNKTDLCEKEGIRLVHIFDDEWNSVTEKRELIIGHDNKHRLLLICFTERNQIIRIISARLVTNKERQDYEQYTKF